MSFPDGLHWPNRYRRFSHAMTGRHGLSLGADLAPQGIGASAWGVHSASAAADLGWPADWWQQGGQPSALDVFSGQGQWPGMAPFASVYSGHQFGQWAGQLGDGRALLLGEVLAPGGLREVQLKGAGLTPYSRRGDGRAVLRSSIREFLCSEAMHALGIPTTRALCLTHSRLPVHRETLETAAVVTRTAPSFLRFGHFEHFAWSRDAASRPVLAELVDFVVEHHFPDLAVLPAEAAHTGQASGGQRALALLQRVTQDTATLMAQWQAVGFCHGVMNTDNMSILGLTIDYGPFGFLDAFDPDHVCNHSDHQGRYRWRQQPGVAQWNLSALAQALSVLVPDAEREDGAGHRQLVDVIQAYEDHFETAMLQRWRDKLGLQSAQATDGALVQGWLSLLATGAVDYTVAWRRLADFPIVPGPAEDGVRDLFLDRDAFDHWAGRYRERLQAEGSDDADRRARMQAVNPRVVLRNHLAQTAIDRATAGDFSEVQRLHDVLANPFDDRSGTEADAGFPPDWARSIEVSCSS